jgi:hypothetical protein
VNTVDSGIRAAFDSIVAEPALRDAALAYALANGGQKRKPARTLLRRLSLAAAAICAVLAFAGLNLYHRETAYISMDVNPSLALSINDYGRVIRVSAYNREAERIADGLPLKNMDYREAVDMLLHSEALRPYLANYPDMWVAVQANDPRKEAAMEQAVQDAVADTVRRHHANISVAYCSVSEQTRADAEAHGVSAAKYQAIIELQELDPAAMVEHYRHNSIHEINQAIESHHGEPGGAPHGDDPASQGHGGHGGNDGYEGSGQPQTHHEDDQQQPSGHSPGGGPHGEDG